MSQPDTTKPRRPWQTGDYAEQQQMDLAIPYQLILLCKLCGTTPKQLLIDFMDNLAHGSWKRQGRDEVRVLLVDYFILHGYAQQTYSEGDMRLLFTEMNAISMLFPNDANAKTLKLHCKWRDRYQRYLYKKWKKAASGK